MNAQDALPGALGDAKINTTIHISVLGRMWMGGVAAYDYTIDDRQIKRQESPIVVAGDLWIPDDMSDLDAIGSWLDTNNTGDFQEIVGARVLKVERAVVAQKVQDNGWDVSTHYLRETVLRDFTEDEEMQYNNCMFGDED